MMSRVFILKKSAGLAALATALLIGAHAPWTPAWADDTPGTVQANVSYDLDDYGVASMSEAVRHIQNNVGGQILKIKLDTKKRPDKWKYKTKVLLPDGSMVKFEHNARTLSVLKVKVDS